MRQKIVGYPHSAQLYGLYRQGKEACSTYWVKVHRLFDDADITKEVDPYQAVMDILRQIPRTSLQAKFTADIMDADKKLGKLYAQHNYAGYIKVLLRNYDKLKTRVERLPEIISDYEKFRSETGKATTKRIRPDVVYRLEYDEMNKGRRNCVRHSTVNEHDEKVKIVNQ